MPPLPMNSIDVLRLSLAAVYRVPDPDAGR
jgi:hypothetical protein